LTKQILDLAEQDSLFMPVHVFPVVCCWKRTLFASHGLWLKSTYYHSI